MPTSKPLFRVLYKKSFHSTTDISTNIRKILELGQLLMNKSGTNGKNTEMEKNKLFTILVHKLRFFKNNFLKLRQFVHIKDTPSRCLIDSMLVNHFKLSRSMIEP